MALRLHDIQVSANKAVPNLELEYEIKHKNGKVAEKVVTLRNLVRLPEKDRRDVAQVLDSVWREDESEEEAQDEASSFRKLSRRIEGAFRKLADDERALEEFLSFLDPENGDYDAYLIAIVGEYYKATGLGEASASDNS